ncbi:MAG: hypothetical protein K0Q68_24 [Moraxellaceae bacterium]|nr:hypothetical protein [Moraxellaceae bacterium]
MSFFLRRLAAIGLLLSAGLASAAEPDAPRFDPDAFEASLQYQTGQVTLPNGKAVLNLGERFRYLSPADTARVLEEAWGNPAGPKTQGMIVPATVGPVDEGGWGVIVQYDDSGHVGDKDASEINYDELLATMKEETGEANVERSKAGYQTVDIVGWASKPYYDSARNRLHWAKELHFSGEPQNTLNYNIRVLGREGVLVLNAVAGMDQLASIRPDLDAMVTVADFTPGHRYADFQEGSDRSAEYGLAALVAGGVAAKAGWLAPLLLFAKKFLVLILVGLGWLGQRLFKVFRKDA